MPLNLITNEIGLALLLKELKELEKPCRGSLRTLISNSQCAIKTFVGSNKQYEVSRISCTIIISCNIIKIFRPVAQQSTSKLPPLPPIELDRQREREGTARVRDRERVGRHIWSSFRQTNRLA